MKWLIGMRIAGSAALFIAACNEKDKAERGPMLAAAIVALYSDIEPLLGNKPGVLKVRAIVAEFLPQIAARFGA
jgi:hypothetical protein